ncbi:MAG: hypothetical protein WCH99_19245 [Verrucomicrobiota bacterium]
MCNIAVAVRGSLLGENSAPPACRSMPAFIIISLPEISAAILTVFGWNTPFLVLQYQPDALRFLVGVAGDSCCRVPAQHLCHLCSSVAQVVFNCGVPAALNSGGGDLFAVDNRHSPLKFFSIQDVIYPCAAGDGCVFLIYRIYRNLKNP